MLQASVRIDDRELREMIEKSEIESGVLWIGALERIGVEVISELRALTSNMVPPAVAGEGPRYAHPGGWADVTGALVNAYRFEVHDARGRVRWMPDDRVRQQRAAKKAGVQPLRPITVNGSIPAKPQPPYTLVLINSMEYAVYLEARDGLFVLSGAVEYGGPLDRALKNTIAAIGGTIQ